MNLKKYLLIIIVLSVFLSISCINASQTADNIINDSQDFQLKSQMDDNIIENTIQEDKTLSDEDINSFSALQKIISDAKEGDTVILDKNYSYFEEDNNGGISIRNSITIDGKGFTLDGRNSARIFELGCENTKTTIILKNIIFINGHEEFGGSAINVYCYSKEIYLQIDNCTFENNYGSAIYCVINNVINSHLNITGCRFINNTAIYDGGAIVSQGKSTIIENSIFKNNSATGHGGPARGLGGALYIADDKPAYIKNSVFESNHAKSAGGAISYSSSEPMTVSNCNFTQNTAKYGGAIWLLCNYDNCLISNSTFKSNRAEKSGGAISIGYHAILENNIFIDNNLPELEVEYEPDIGLKYMRAKDFDVKIVNTLTREPVSGVKVEIYVNVFTGENKYTTKVLSAISDENGIATFKSIDKISRYDYYGFITLQKSFSFVNKTKYYGYFNDPISKNDNHWKVFSIIYKAQTNVNTTQLKAKYGQSKYFKVNITSNGKPIKNLKIKLKIYTGKKYKTYTVKTDKNGIAKFNTKNLNGGSHKVLIQTGNKKYNYIINGKSKIIIKGFETVAKGSKNKVIIKKIQKALKKKGYYRTYRGQYLKIDGKYNKHTKNAVKKFQRAKKLKVTGKVDEKTAKKLKII